MYTDNNNNRRTRTLQPSVHQDIVVRSTEESVILEKGREATGNNNMANGFPLPSCT